MAKYKELAELEGVISVGRTLQGVEVEVLKGYSPPLPKEIDGLIINKIEVDKDYEEDTEIYNTSHRPIRPGTILRGERSGSVGFCFSYEGQQFLVTAYHLLQDVKNPQEGIKMWQQNVFTRDTDTPIAEVYMWPDLYTENPGAGDIMVLKMADNKRGLNKTLSDNITLDRLREPELGMPVKRVGRTTGVQEGKVDKIDMTMKRRGDCFTTGQTWSHMFRYGAHSQGGDSGGTVYTEDGEVLGIHCATGGHGASAIPALEHFGFAIRNIRINSKSVEMWLDYKHYKVDGEEKEMDIKPQVIEIDGGGRTVVPIRFVAEALGYDVTYLEDERKIIIDG